jgi:hypothetical protein
LVNPVKISSMSSVGNQGRSGAQSVRTADRVGDLNTLDASLCIALTSCPSQEVKDAKSMFTTAPAAVEGCSTLGAKTEGIPAFHPAPHPLPAISVTKVDIGSSLSATEELTLPVEQLGQTSDAFLRQHASISGTAQQRGTAAAVAQVNETGDQGLLQTHSQPPQTSLSPESLEPSCHYYLPKGLLSLSLESQGTEAAIFYEAQTRKLRAEAACQVTQESTAPGSRRAKKRGAAVEAPWQAAVVAMRNAPHRELSSKIDGVFQMDDLLNDDAAHEFCDPSELYAATDDEDSEYDEDSDDDDEWQVQDGTPRPPLSKTIKRMIVFYEEKWRARLARAKLRCVTPEHIVRGFCCR